MPGMIATIDAAVLGALCAMVLIVLGLGPQPAFLLGIAIGILFISVLAASAGRYFLSASRGLTVAFPHPRFGQPQDGRRNT
jgi:ABC-type transport system involved in cytochrome c biogenesis permease component